MNHKPLLLLKVNLKYTPFVNISVTIHLDIILASIAIGEPNIYDDTLGHH